MNSIVKVISLVFIKQPKNIRLNSTLPYYENSK